jgi:hypothetical protein
MQEPSVDAPLVIKKLVQALAFPKQKTRANATIAVNTFFIGYRFVDDYKFEPTKIGKCFFRSADLHNCFLTMVYDNDYDHFNFDEKVIVIVNGRSFEKSLR